MRIPGALNPYSPYSARLVQKHGFEAVHLSGAVLSAELCLPAIGLTTSAETAARAQQVTRVTDLPVLIDADTGFGAPVNAARTASSSRTPAWRVCTWRTRRPSSAAATSKARRSSRAGRWRNGCARPPTPDATATSSSWPAPTRGRSRASTRRSTAKAYVDAGADAIFPEALADEAEFAAFRRALDVPLLANLTEFGKTPLLGARTPEDLGYNLALYPVTLFRLANGAVEDGLRTLAAEGTQGSLLPRMQTRSRLHEVLGCADYSAFDSAVPPDARTPGRRSSAR